MWERRGGGVFEFERIVCCCRLRVCGCLSFRLFGFANHIVFLTDI